MDFEIDFCKLVSVKGYNERVKTPNKPKADFCQSPLLFRENINKFQFLGLILCLLLKRFG